MQRIDLLRKAFNESERVLDFLDKVNVNGLVRISGLAGSATAFLLAEVYANRREPLLAVMPTEKQAFAMASDLREICGEECVYSFPIWGIHPYDWLVPPAENVSGRIEAVWRLSEQKPVIVVASAAALMQPTISRNDLAESCFQLRLDQEYDLEDIADRLTRMGYERKPVTEEVGSFSIRGGILDLFPYTSANPVRCEFFGDLIESMRYFSVVSQRSVENIDQVAIIPRRELLWSDDELEARIERLPAETAETLRVKCYNGFGYPGLEWAASLLDGGRTYLFDYLTDNCRVYLHDPELLISRVLERSEGAVQLHDQVIAKFPAAPEPGLIYLTEKEMLVRINGRARIEEITLGSPEDAVNFGMKEHPALGGQVKILRQQLEDYLTDEQAVFITTDSEMQAERFRELLSEFSEQVHFVVNQLQAGFVFPEANMVLLTDHQIFDRRLIRRRHRKFKEGAAISSYQALEFGDYIVHVDYGIGRYRGLVDISISGQKRECLLIKYADDAKLYVPVEEFGRVQKYIGKEGKPGLTRLGGKTWDKVKARTKKAIADMAEELLKIYARRKAEPGIAFKADDEWMNQLEASFPYDETPDQRESIAVIKKDMEQATPTDRLVCGDVGFGKTEVAIRAALKAVISGKQVAVLVPTTILAQQHLTTFRSRLQQFPIRVEMLSRFKTRQEQKAIVADLGEGKVDVVIGTHRLLSKDMELPNLGLLIVDEEHRFGVAHKEKLKKIRATVDCLALSATPIPRTLHMSLLSVRDISMITTPPKFRQPIVTEIAEFDPKIIYEAITDEVARRGQVYFVHNRVQSIMSMHQYLSKLLNPIRIVVAHGQMPEKELEDVMLAFLNREYDVLLSTSIIESGIDIPSVNTIIINRADRFGLAQLYQLRGRVGRSLERAFAYMLVPPVRLLTDTARKRLKAIEQHTELGSGFHLAMRDLEIRGAGNLLGPQQHGFIEEVGFDLYCRLLEEAVAELKGEPLPGIKEVKIEADADIYIPDEYIEDQTQRVEIYRKISEARSSDDLQQVGAELLDRFGRYSAPVENLLDLMEVRLLASAREIDRIKLQQNSLTLAYSNGHLPSKANVEKFRAAAPDKVEFDASEGFVIRLTFAEEASRPLAETKKLLQLL